MSESSDERLQRACEIKINLPLPPLIKGRCLQGGGDRGDKDRLPDLSSEANAQEES